MNRKRKENLKAKYGLTQEWYDEILRLQHGKCAICRRPETRKLHGKVVALSVDHNHVTGKIRGLLCQKCNTALGMVNDDPETARNMAFYLYQSDQI